MAEIATVYKDLNKSAKKRGDEELYSWRKMHSAMSADDLINSHRSVVNYWTPYNNKREMMHDFRKGRHWSEEELVLMRNKGKAPVVFNKIIAAVRTIMGTFISNKYDIKPAPFEPNDQDISDILTQRYHWNFHQTNCRWLDLELVQECVVGGSAWQESYVEVVPGDKPRIVVCNQNSLAIYPDPNSRDLVNRFDCEFIDRDSWLNCGELAARYPEWAEEIEDELGDFAEATDGSYESNKRYAERSHETRDEKNGRFLVTERFYRVHKKVWHGINADKKERIDIGLDDGGAKRKAFLKHNPDFKVYARSKEFLYHAVVCPAFRNNTFLSNEQYHNQPRDPVTKRIMFPLVQCFAEHLDGETNGYVEYDIGPQKVINSMMANKLHAAKHAVNTSLMIDPSKMQDDQVDDFQKHHSDGDRVFHVKPGENPAGVAALLPQGKSAPDTNESLEFADRFFEEVSAAPPSSRGMAEGNVPARLNQQRIEQAFLQLNTFIEYWKLFLTKRAKLWQYYDRTYFTTEETFRVIQKKNEKDDDFVTVNQWMIDQTGVIKKANDISSAVYDIVFEDSYQSASVRDKVRQQIVELQQSNAVQSDPVLNTFLTMYFLKMSDSPQDLKDFVQEHSTVVKQWQQMNQQTGLQSQELDNAQKLQNMAQTEAAQTVGSPQQLGPEQSQAPTEIPQQSQALVAG